MTDDFKIEDILFQSQERVVFRAQGSEDLPCTITRLKYPREILKKLSATRFARSLVELKGHDIPCLRPVIDGGLDPVDHSPWIATVVWEGESLQERLDTAKLTPEICSRIESNARATIQTLGSEAGDLSFDPRDIVATLAGDGQVVESFVIDYYKWFYDWATGKSVGSRRDPEEELSALLDELDPARKAKMKLPIAPSGPTVMTPAKLIPNPSSVVVKKTLAPQPSAAAQQAPAAGQASPPAALSAAVQGNPASPVQPTPVPGQATPVTPPAPILSKTPAAVNTPVVAPIPPPAPSSPLVSTTPTPPQTTAVLTPPITAGLTPSLASTRTPGTAVAGAGVTGSSPSLTLPSGASKGTNFPLIIGALVCALAVLIGVAVWMSGRDERNAVADASQEKTTQTQAAPPARKPIRRTLPPRDPDPIDNAAPAQPVSENPSEIDDEESGFTPPGRKTAKLFTLADEAEMRTMDGQVATMAGKVKVVLTHGKNTYLKFKNAQPQVAAGVELGRAKEGLNMEYLRSLEGKTIEIYGTVKVEGNHRLVVFFSKKSAIKVVADLPETEAE